MVFLKKWGTCLIVMVVGIIAFIFCLVTFNGKIENSVKSEMKYFVNNIRDNALVMFNNEIARFSNCISDEATLLSQMNLSTKEAVIEELTSFSAIHRLSKVSLLSISGNVYSSNSDTIETFDPDTIAEGSFDKGDHTFNLKPVEVDGQVYIETSTPIYLDSKLVGILKGRNPISILNETFANYFLEDDCGVGIITPEGSTLAKSNVMPVTLPDVSNLLEFFKSDNISFTQGNIDGIKSDMSKNKSGIAICSSDGVTCYISYTPVGISDWYIYSISSDTALVKRSSAINGYAFQLVIQLFGIIAFIVGWVFLIRRRDSKQYFNELTKIAYVDSLTGAANKKQFKLFASQLLETKSNVYAFLVLDIDKFKVLNDTLGYETGDKLLCIIADTVHDTIGVSEIFGRCDSDEYYLLLKYADNESIQLRVELIFQQIQDRFNSVTNNNYNLVLCVGIYAIQNPLTEINVIMDRAKHAHQLSKGGSNSSISFYSEELHNKILREKTIENRMHDALETSAFMLFLQPKYQLSDETICGAEALVRWNTTDSVMLYPDQFIPVFEKTGFITKLDMYMLEKACILIRSWLEQGIKPVPISINFSRAHLRNSHFVEDIASIVRRYDIPSHLIEVELTESTMMHNEDLLIKVLSQLHEYGFALSMDDFGSGYSSLGLLKNLPVDTIKLDRTFFTQYNDLKRAKTVISNMINMAKELGIYTVAEGVETKEHIDLLRELGCDIVQGYYYAKPMKAEELGIS